jgi:hypothetical protein
MEFVHQTDFLETVCHNTCLSVWPRQAHRRHTEVSVSTVRVKHMNELQADDQQSSTMVDGGSGLIQLPCICPNTQIQSTVTTLVHLCMASGSI